MKKSFTLINGIALIFILSTSCSDTNSIIKKGEEITFNNGLKIVNYSLEAKLPVKEEVSNNQVNLSYNIAWPIEGPSNLVENLQKAIKDYLLEEHEAPEGDGGIEDILMSRYNEIVKETKLEEDEIYDGPISEELTAQIKVLPGIVILDLDNDLTFRSMMGVFDNSERKVFTDEGEIFDYSVIGNASSSFLNSEDSGYMAIFSPESNTTYMDKNEVYLIYKNIYIDHVTAEEKISLKGMVFSPEVLGYENFHEIDVKEDNDAYFISFMFAQAGGMFGVFYKDTYYIIDWFGGENYSELDDTPHFDKSSMSIYFNTLTNEKRMLKLTDLPEDQKIKVNYKWY